MRSSPERHVKAIGCSSSWLCLAALDSGVQNHRRSLHNAMVSFHMMFASRDFSPCNTSTSTASSYLHFWSNQQHNTLSIGATALRVTGRKKRSTASGP